MIGTSTPRSRAWSWTLRVVGTPSATLTIPARTCVERLAPADPLADGAVAAVRAVAGRDHVAHARPGRKKVDGRPPRSTPNRAISTSPRVSSGRLGIIAEAEAVADPRGDPQDVLQGPGQLDAERRRGWCRPGTSPGSGRRGPATQSASSSPATTTEAGRPRASSSAWLGPLRTATGRAPERLDDDPARPGERLVLDPLDHAQDRARPAGAGRRSPSSVARR